MILARICVCVCVCLFDVNFPEFQWLKHGFQSRDRNAHVDGELGTDLGFSAGRAHGLNAHNNLLLLVCFSLSLSLYKTTLPRVCLKVPRGAGGRKMYVTSRGLVEVSPIFPIPERSGHVHVRVKKKRRSARSIPSSSYTMQTVMIAAAAAGSNKHNRKRSKVTTNLHVHVADDDAGENERGSVGNGPRRTRKLL